MALNRLSLLFHIRGQGRPDTTDPQFKHSTVGDAGCSDRRGNGGTGMVRKAAIVILTLAIIFGAAQTTFAVSNAGVLFLRIAAGARAAGMGEAFVAMADDATSTHWNPAGLGQYPMYGKWTEYQTTGARGISQAALVRNISLGGGDATYDVWVLSENQILRLSDEGWETDVALPEGVTEVDDIYSSEKDLYVATDKGLFKNTLWRWTPVVAPSDRGWSAETINDIHVTPGPRVWLATDEGVKVYDRLMWTTYGVDSGLPSPKVFKVYFINSQYGWAVTAAGLARFEEGKFSDVDQVTALIGETVSDLVGRFIGTEDRVRIQRATREVMELNGLESNEIAAGTAVNIPYRLAFESEITCLTTDLSGQLWVGTEKGLKSFSNKRWRSYGYRAWTPDEPITLTDLARAYIEASLGQQATQNRMDAFARWTANYNNLELDATIEAGRTIYLYANPTGGAIRSLMSDGRKMYVGSKYGLLTYDDGQWGRLYQAGLDHADCVAMAQAGRDLWFFTPDKVINYARAQSEFTVMYVKWLPNLAEDIYYGYASFVSHKEGLGTLGANATILSYGEVQRTDRDPTVLGSFNPFDFSFGLSFGTRLTSTLAAGLSAKVIYSRLSEQGAGQERGSGTATAFAMDAGLIYRTPFSRLTLGAALTNLGPDISYIDADQSDPLPRNLALGFAYRLADSPYNRLVFTAEINKDLIDFGADASTELKQIIYNAGMEYWYAGLVALRVGYIYDEDGDIKTPTVGGGLSWKGMGIDLAYVPSVREDQVMANIMRISFTGQF